MLLVAVSSGRGGDVVGWVRRAAQAGVDCIQIREKGLEGGALFTVCIRAREATTGMGARLMVNDRLDVALAAGLDGVHLPARGLPVAAARRASPAGFLITRSCHSMEELENAAGADFCVYGPVFATPSKAAFGAPPGLAGLRAVCARAAMPVLAIGGIDAQTTASCIEAGAAGIAAIRLFEADPASVVHELRALGTRLGGNA